MATGTTPNYSLPYPISTDPVRIAQDIEQLATEIDTILNEEIQDASALMLTSGTFTNGINTPVYNDATGTINMSLAQDIRTSASPQFNSLILTGDIEVRGGDITTNQTTFNLLNATTTTLNIGGATTTINIGGTSSTINSFGDINLSSGKQITINGSLAINSNSLGSSIVSSSLSSVGTITTGTWSATEIAANKGGTGHTSYTVGDILYASSSSALSKLADVATGSALISGGVGAAPSWGKIGLATHVSGTLPVANGGTGTTTSTGTTNIVLSDSPTFTGIPLAPTATEGTDTTQIATTEFVQTAVSAITLLPSQSGNDGKILITDGTQAYWTDTIDGGTI